MTVDAENFRRPEGPEREIGVIAPRTPCRQTRCRRLGNKSSPENLYANEGRLFGVGDFSFWRCRADRALPPADRD